MKNMQAATLLSISVLYFLAGSECLSQIMADSGNDTAVWADMVTFTIRGNPTAVGGVPPYTYTWSGSYNISQCVFTASYMPEDTTESNPVFREGAIPDSVVLYVTVIDANVSVGIGFNHGGSMGQANGKHFVHTDDHRFNWLSNGKLILCVPAE